MDETGASGDKKLVTVVTGVRSNAVKPVSPPNNERGSHVTPDHRTQLACSFIPARIVSHSIRDNLTKTGKWTAAASSC